MAGSPYVVIGDVWVEVGVTLTIEPGVEVKFDDTFSIYVNGSIIAIGTTINRIIITSNRAIPVRGDWNNIQINSNGHAEIKFCEISYGTSGIYVNSALNNNITNNIITYNYEGIYLDLSSQNNLIDNIISNNTAGIEIFGSSKNIILNNNISSNTIDGIRLRESSNNTIADNNISNNGEIGDWGVGIHLSSSSNITIINNNFFNDGIFISGDQLSHFNTHTIPDINAVNGKPLYYYKDSSGINFDGIPVGQLILANCTDIRAKNLHIDNTEVGIEVAYSDNVSITNNNISFNRALGIFLYQSSNSTIRNNNVSSIRGSGVSLEWSSNNSITNNNVISCGSGIFLDLSSNWNTVASNSVLSNVIFGFILDDASNHNIISKNNVTNNQVGIDLISSSNSTITRNYVSNNDYGISLLSSSLENLITMNTLLSNSYYGIFLWSSSDKNTIVNNNISNSDFGFITESSNNNKITGNSISNNSNGIYFKTSSNNTIYHNNIIGNVIQAFDDMNNNIWNDSYPSGGNYWSDFDEPGEGAYDDYKGPNQDDPASWDGIVDNGTMGGGGKNPYVIDSDSQDIYPLIYPTDISPPTITNLQPADGSMTNTSIPLIGANYTDFSGINISSVILKVDGINVTSSATVTTSGVSYIPGTNLSDGVHTVYLEVKDIVGNLATETWTFTVDTSLAPPKNLTTKIVNNGNNVELEWDPPSSSALDHYLIYRAESATEFDFSTLINSSTTWPDPKSTIWVDPDTSITQIDDDFYYIICAANSDESDISMTSNTAGVWTRTFELGISTFSLPLEPFEGKDTEYYCQDMNASYIKWLNHTTHTWMRHDKGAFKNNTFLELGEGYEVAFDGQTNYTFCGMPGAMIVYDEGDGFAGFDPGSEVKNITAFVDAEGNVTLMWQEPLTMVIGDWYEVYYSNTRDGFFETFGVDYDLACPAIGFGTNTTTISDLGAANPGTRLYFMVVPFNATGVRGSSTYSIGMWTEEYLAGYDTIGIPLKMEENYTVDWYCENIPYCVGINYYFFDQQRWGWHSIRMAEGAFDVAMEMAVGYQISTSNVTKFTFIGI